MSLQLNNRAYDPVHLNSVKLLCNKIFNDPSPQVQWALVYLTISVPHMSDKPDVG